jgi:hypothetical protein
LIRLARIQATVTSHRRPKARIIYLYVAIAARIYLLRCYAKNVRTDLTAEEKKELRQIAAHLKGVQ